MKERIGLILWLLTASAFGAWFSVSWLDNQIPYDYIREGSGLMPNPSHQGEQVTLHWKIKVHRTCPGSVQRTIVNRDTGKTVATYDMIPSAATIKLGDTDLYKTFMLPSHLPSHVEYRANVRFHCNLLQQFFPLTLALPHVQFDVID